jgi:hypothetical protein
VILATLPRGLDTSNTGANSNVIPPIYLSKALVADPSSVTVIVVSSSLPEGI